jgi:hypothetical protein
MKLIQYYNKNKKIKKEKLIFLIKYIYNEIFNKILIIKFLNFIKKQKINYILINKNFIIKITQTLKIPQINIENNIFITEYLQKTHYLKNIRFYKKLIKLLPFIDIFQQINLINRILTNELNRTKKH